MLPLNPLEFKRLFIPYCKMSMIPRSGRCGGIICDPGGNTIVSFTWGLGQVSNNLAEAYAIWEGIRIAIGMGIQNHSILGDSMMVIRTLIKRNVTGNSVFLSVMSRSLALLDGTNFKLFHVKRELNHEADRWAKFGTSLAEGELIVNGVKEWLPLP